MYTLLLNGGREVECYLSRPVDQEICIGGPFKGPGVHKNIPKIADVLEVGKRPMGLVTNITWIDSDQKSLIFTEVYNTFHTTDFLQIFPDYT